MTLARGIMINLFNYSMREKWQHSPRLSHERKAVRRRHDLKETDFRKRTCPHVRRFPCARKQRNDSRNQGFHRLANCTDVRFRYDMRFTGDLQ